MSSRLTVVLLSLLLATPVVVYWLWLMIVPARVAILCPEECKCDTAGYYMECENSSLNIVPLIRLTDIIEFWIAGDNITLLMKDSFVSLTELDALGVWWCELRTIQLGAFNGLRKLKYLNILHTDIREILNRTFENLSNLEYLYINYNKLQHLDSHVFSGLGNLRVLDLEDNNLQYLHPDTFLGLPNIESINLNKNPLLQIPTKSNFIKSHSLPFLNISACNINSLSAETFTNVSALEYLNLRDNNLKTVDINILRALPKLSEFYLNGNPLQCDCQLQEVWRLCEDRNIRTGKLESAPTCDTPSEVKGFFWGVLEKGECLDGNIQYCGDSNINCSYTDFDVKYRETEKGTYTQQHTIVPHLLAQYQAPIYAVPFLFGTACNVIVLITIICNKDMRTVPNMYIINLAISDIIYLTVLFSEACANTISETWQKHDFMCKFPPFCRRLSVGLSAYSVAVLSIQRYRVIVNPLHVHVSSPPTWRVTVATICGVWIVAALFAIPSAVSNVVCQQLEGIVYMTYYKNVVIFELLVSCVLPLCVIGFTYIKTARHLLSSMRISGGRNKIQLNTRRTTARMVVGLTVVFLISFLPYHVLWTYIIFNEIATDYYEVMTFTLLESNSKLGIMYLISTCFLLLNSCLNAVALFCTSSQFRQHLKRYLTCSCKTNSPSNVLELTSTSEFNST
jgi:hypothetical protein